MRRPEHLAAALSQVGVFCVEHRQTVYLWKRERGDCGEEPKSFSIPNISITQPGSECSGEKRRQIAKSNILTERWLSSYPLLLLEPERNRTRTQYRRHEAPQGDLLTAPQPAMPDLLSLLPQMLGDNKPRRRQAGHHQRLQSASDQADWGV